MVDRALARLYERLGSGMSVLDSDGQAVVEQRGGRAVVRVSDDGVGGAVLGAGSGLTGLADRVAAFDGSLSVRSPAGEGTIIEASVPLEIAGT